MSQSPGMPTLATVVRGLGSRRRPRPPPPPRRRGRVVDSTSSSSASRSSESEEVAGDCGGEESAEDDCVDEPSECEDIESTESARSAPPAKQSVADDVSRRVEALHAAENRTVARSGALVVPSTSRVVPIVTARPCLVLSHRLLTSPLVSVLRASHVRVCVTRLPFADMVLSSHVAVVRRSSSELVTSAEQPAKLHETVRLFNFCCVLI